MSNLDNQTTASRTEVESFKVGNKVRVMSHQVTTMQGFEVEGHLSGHEGFIVEFARDYHWRDIANRAVVRLYFDKDPITNEFGHAYNTTIDLALLEVIEDSVGEVVVGKTCPYARSELRQLYIEQQLKEVERFDFSAQGYRNMATHLAALYLNQEPRFHEQLKRLKRVDGTVNPKKVQKAFQQLGVKVDEQAFEVPNKFSTVDKDYYREIHVAIARQQAIDWNEVAEDVAA